MILSLFFYRYGDHRDLHGLTHSFPTRRSSDLLNATFYNSPDREQVETWKDKTPEDFRFFPKIPNTISHFKRLLNIQEPVNAFCDAISNFEEKLGMSFLQMHDNFKPKDFDREESYVNQYQQTIPLAVEMRNTEWFTDKTAAENFYHLLESKGRTNIIVDTAGRRDIDRKSTRLNPATNA